MLDSVPDHDKPAIQAASSLVSPFSAPILKSVGDWMPSSPHDLNKWLESKLKDLEHKRYGQEREVVSAFRKLIETDPEVYMGFHRMFENVPDKDLVGRSQVKDYDTMLRLFNCFLSEAPEFNEEFLVFLPFTAVLQWPMVMTNGFTILVNRQVNSHFRNLFRVWAQYLTSEHSRYVLTKRDNRWLGVKAMEKMPEFIETFICDRAKPHWGFRSWDHFFARHLRDGAHPVLAPHHSSVITSACKSKVLRIARDVRETNKFWIKGQPYSLRHMLNNATEVSSFVGGTVYQAFLSPFYYHRWSSPVAGTIVKVDVVEGTYFAGVPGDSQQPPSIANEALQGDQSFITHVAMRALIFIKAHDPQIGLMCFVGVGMVKVSSCEVTVKVGQQVKKGQEIGTFHFGGSTHCLVFRPEIRLSFLVKDGDFVKVHGGIAQLTE